MKRTICIIALITALCVMMTGCGANSGTPVNTNDSKAADTETSVNAITEEMAYNAVDNYCHSKYDWEPAEEDKAEMYVALGDETETEYEVVFRSYTGALVRFYVDKETGIARMVEEVPNMDIKEDAGTINIFDYLDQE